MMQKMEIDTRKLQEINDLCRMLSERCEDVRFSTRNLGVLGPVGLQHSTMQPQFVPYGSQPLPIAPTSIPGQFVQQQPWQPNGSTGLSHTTPYQPVPQYPTTPVSISGQFAQQWPLYSTGLSHTTPFIDPRTIPYQLVPQYPTTPVSIPGQFAQQWPLYSTGLSHTNPLFEQERMLQTFPNARQSFVPIY